MMRHTATLTARVRLARTRGLPTSHGVRRCYSTQQGAPLRKKVTAAEVARKYRRGEPISMCTASDFPSVWKNARPTSLMAVPNPLIPGQALHVDRSGMDVILVGDSLAMVQLVRLRRGRSRSRPRWAPTAPPPQGHDTTLPVDMETMLVHAKAVARAANCSLLVGDMPFGSYEICPKEAARNAVRYLKVRGSEALLPTVPRRPAPPRQEAGMDAVKLEGATSGRVDATRAIVDAGISVMGHIGLTPQSISVLGGFRAQGKTGALSRPPLRRPHSTAATPSLS